jgi:hypothetical protein
MGVTLGVSELPYLRLILASHVSHCLPMFAPVAFKSLSESYPGSSTFREPLPSPAGLTLAW